MIHRLPRRPLLANPHAQRIVAPLLSARCCCCCGRRLCTAFDVPVYLVPTPIGDLPAPWSPDWPLLFGALW